MFTRGSYALKQSGVSVTIAATMSPNRRKILVGGAAVLLVAFVGIQFVPVTRTNPIGTGDPPASREVMWILRRACYDCHSNETRWPIWAYVAPVSWQVVGDVDRARRVLNFSTWASLAPEQQAAQRHTVNWTTSAHRMPAWYYVTLHPDAKLEMTELNTLASWARGDSTK
jgi:hypothetical protein